MVVLLAFTLFAAQAGFHGFTASMPLVLARSGVPDAEIGLVMGAAPVVQLGAAFLVGAVIDRFGGARVLLVGVGAYLASAAILLLPGVDPATDRLPYLVSRLIQGLGVATAMPSALSLVPRFMPAARRGLGLGVVGSARDLALVVMPPLSLLVLGTTRSLDGVALMVAAFVAAGGVLGWLISRTERGGNAGTARTAGAAPPTRAHRIRPTFRREWANALAAVFLQFVHWGVIIAFLPARAEAAGADIGLFFAADGIAILATRIPGGWLADRQPPRRLVLAGMALTAVSVAILFLPPTTPLLIASGILIGIGGGFILTPLLLLLTRRSTDADRGSVFSLFSASIAGSISLGSVGGAGLVALGGFDLALAFGLVALGFAAIAIALDRDPVAPPSGVAPGPSAAGAR